MGYDYSGGGLNGPNRHMAEAIKRIRAGQTRSQQRDALFDKVLVHGGMAAIGAVGHAMEAGESMEKQNNAKKAGIMRNAIADQTQRAAQEQANQNVLPTYDGSGVEAEREVAIPSWLSQSQGDSTVDAEAAKAHQKANAAAALVSVGGYHTPDGIENTSMEAGAQVRDNQTAKDMMSMGGMMNSLPRVSRDGLEPR